MTYRQPFSGEWPITQYYGETVTSSFHTGIDYGCPLGTAIMASADGVIRYAGFDQTGYGNCVIIEHDVSHATLYAHLSMIRFTVTGKVVKQGEVIGYSGNTGNSTGPHLHFEARSIWNDYRSHFDPFKLPLMSVDDSINFSKPVVTEPTFEPSEIIPGIVEIVAPDGAFNHTTGFTSKVAYPKGTKYYYTGKTIENGGLTYCECLPFYSAVWIARNNSDTQILMNK